MISVYDIGLVIPNILPTTVVTRMVKFSKNKVLKYLWLSKDVDVGLLRPSTIPQVIAEVVDIGLLRPSTLPQVILEDILVEVDIGHNLLATLPFVIGEQYFMLKVEVYIGIIPATIPPIIKLTVVDC